MTQSKKLVRAQMKVLDARMPVRMQEREIMKMGTDRRWPFLVLGAAPVPPVPIFHNGWWLVPIIEDHSPIPERSMERVHALFEAGIRPKAFVIAHEAPMQLRAPANTPRVSPLEFWVQRLTAHSIAALQITGKILTTVVLPLTVAVLGVTLSAMVGLAAVALSDPCLIAVTDDDVWIQIDFWTTE